MGRLQLKAIFGVTGRYWPQSGHTRGVISSDAYNWNRPGAEPAPGLTPPRNDYGEALTPSALSHSINRGTLSLQRALQILAISGVSEVEIK